MEESISSPTSPNVKKRAAPDEDSPEKRPLNLKGTQFMMPTPPDTDDSSNASPTCNSDSAARRASPAPSSALSTVESISTNTVQQAPTAPATGGLPPAKRRKLTPTQREQEKREKEAKAAEKSALKASKDAVKAEHKARKDEEKQKKDEEKRVKNEERESKKREKEVAEERKNQEKLKKERAQMRLGVFFQHAATPTKPFLDDESPRSTARRKSLSLEPFDAVADQIRRSASPCKSSAQPVTAQNTPIRDTVSDYQKYFLPFQLQTHCSMTSIHAVEDYGRAQEAFDLELNELSLGEKYDLGLVDSYASLSQHFTDEQPRGHLFPSMRQLVEQIQGSMQQPIDLTDEEVETNPLDVLQTVPRRYLEFHEDVRPAYFGTYTKINSTRASRKLRRNPFHRTRTDTDYDYDSEAEWEESEEGDEGEDILDDDDEEAESVGDAHEMDEFLDDEGDAQKNKRKLITGDLIPASTGLCWENDSGRIMPSIEGRNPYGAMRGMRMGVLLSGFNGPTIDPFSTAYWHNEETPTPQAVQEPAAAQINTLMPPPRPPLQPRPNGNATLDYLIRDSPGAEKRLVPEGTGSKKHSVPKGTVTRLSKEDLEEFKEFVVGNQANKGELLKELKARFPKLTNDTIKSTLSERFAQVGAKQSEKRWTFVSAS